GSPPGHGRPRGIAVPAPAAGDDPAAVAALQLLVGHARQAAPAGGLDQLQIVVGAGPPAGEPPGSFLRAAEAAIEESFVGQDLIFAHRSEAAAIAAGARAGLDIECIAPEA